MGRKRVIPIIDEDKMGGNPFAENLVIPVTKKTQSVLNKFQEQDIKEFDLEVTPYVKVFDHKVFNEKMPFNKLPLRSKELFFYFLMKIKPTKDFLYLDKVSYMAEMGIGSVNTFKEAVKQLAVSKYITKHDFIHDVYWINPRAFFKGSRINKYKSKVEYKISQNIDK